MEGGGRASLHGTALRYPGAGRGNRGLYAELIIATLEPQLSFRSLRKTIFFLACLSGRYCSV
jgi:hypothetical protein